VYALVKLLARTMEDQGGHVRLRAAAKQAEAVPA
jgi:hypothetical protein